MHVRIRADWICVRSGWGVVSRGLNRPFPPPFDLPEMLQCVRELLPRSSHGLARDWLINARAKKETRQ